MEYIEKLRKALDAFDDALRYREHYSQNQIASQESSCRINQALNADVLKVIVKALKKELEESCEPIKVTRDNGDNSADWCGDGERCEVCGNLLFRDKDGELRCFDCNPYGFAVGDRVEFICNGERATIMHMDGCYFEVMDDNGNISACHLDDIAKVKKRWERR